MKTRNGEELLTLKDLARRIAFAKTEAGISRAARQIRHWTQNDLLLPYSEKKTGTGIPRLYLAEQSMQIAAILLELSRYGATVDIMKPAAEALYEDIEEGGESVFLATTSEGFSFLQVAWKEDPETGRFIDAEVQFFDQTEFTEEDELLYGPSSSILINMNRVMDRVYDFRT